ncbi:MAG: hypothetical protein GX616_00210 [Planctomycetes bacterium]|nr:hypothetical protein [Planctomycetota bacterium]
MTQDVQTKKRRPLWLRLILYLSPLWIILAIVLSVEIAGRRAYNLAMQEARNIGGPVTIEEIEAARKVWPDDRNGATVFLQIAPRLPESRDDERCKSLPVVGRAKMPTLGERWTADTEVDVAKFLASAAKELSEIDGLIEYEGGRFPITHQPNPLDTELPHLAKLRAAARLKSLQTIRAVMSGTTGSTTTDLRVIWRLGDLLTDEPSIISSLVRVAIQALSVDTLQHVLGQRSLTPPQLADIDSQFRAAEDEDSMLWGIRGERALVKGLGEWMRATGRAPPIMESRLSVIANNCGLSGWLMCDEARAWGLLNSLVDTKRGRERIALAAAILLEGQSSSRLFPFTRSVTPHLARAMELDLRVVAMIRSAHAALAAESYRLTHGEFPEKLDDLVPDFTSRVPADPFDDQPLRYSIDTDAVVIYSIGEDGRDDGGKVEHRLPPGTEILDWGFVLLKPEDRGRPASTTAPATQGAEATAVSTGPAR